MQNDPNTEKQIAEMKLVMELAVQQALLRGQMEGLASVLEALEPKLGVMPATQGLAATVSICASEWAQPLLADMRMTVGGLEADLEVIKVHEFGAIVAFKGLELAQAHAFVSRALQEKAEALIAPGSPA